MIAVASLAQTASQLVTPEIRRVGDKLACLCGSCKNTVASCPLLGCHYAEPSRQKIAKFQNMGMSDQGIIDTFVKETGLSALAVPPAEGFNMLAWIMPFLMIGVGLAAIWLFIRRIRPKRAATAPQLDNEALSKYHEQIEKDLAKLD